MGGEGQQLSLRAGGRRGRRTSREKGLFPRRGWRESCCRLVLGLQAAAGSARSPRKVTLFDYVQPLGWDPVDTPLEFRNLRPTSPVPTCRCGRLPGIYSHAPLHLPPRRPLPAPQLGWGWALTRALESPPKARAGEGRGAGGGSSALGSHFKARSPFQVGSDLNP